MYVLKSNGHVYGAKLSKTEQKAMQIEIDRQAAENLRQMELNVDALILWELHEQLHLGPKRLKQFYDNFNTQYDQLINHYELNEGQGDGLWLIRKQLLEYGIDIEQWDKEKK